MPLLAPFFMSFTCMYVRPCSVRIAPRRGFVSASGLDPATVNHEPLVGHHRHSKSRRAAPKCRLSRACPVGTPKLGAAPRRAFPAPRCPGQHAASRAPARGSAPRRSAPSRAPSVQHAKRRAAVGEDDAARTANTVPRRSSVPEEEGETAPTWRHRMSQKHFLRPPLMHHRSTRVSARTSPCRDPTRRRETCREPTPRRAAGAAHRSTRVRCPS